MNLPELLKHYRKKEGLLIRELAAKLEVDTAIVSKIETGNRRPTKKQLYKYTVIFNIDYGYLHTLWLSEKVYHVIKETPKSLSILEIVTKRIQEEK